MHIVTQAVADGLLWGCLYAVISIGLSLIFGVAEIVNFAHGAFLMVAMYVAYFVDVQLGFSPLLAVPVCIACLFVVGALTHKLLIRHVLSSTFFAQMIVTFGLLIFLQGAAQLVYGANYQSVHVAWFQASTPVAGLYLGNGLLLTAAVTLGLTVLLYLLVMRTQVGLEMRAVAENRQVAALMGVNVERIYVLTWGIGSACVGAAGALLASFYYVFPTVGTEFGLLAFVVVCLGGFGSLEGAFVAGLIVGLLQTLSGIFVAPSYQYAVVFAAFFVFVVIRPRGLLGRF